MNNPIDWSVLLGFLAFTTWFGHRLKGKGADSLDSFFRGGRDVPWWAVSASLIATKTSALTFIAVPAAVYAAGGDLRYLQITIGFILGNFLMARFFMGAYYDADVYNPYDFIAQKLGVSVGHLARVLFVIGAVLSQAIRLLSTALILSVVTGFSIATCIWIIGAFSVLWAWFGGVTTVIWTDVLQFGVFTLGALVSVAWLLHLVPDGFPGILSAADERAKLVFLDLSLDPTKTFTLWVGLIGASFFELGANAVDQVVTQRALCCKSVHEARRAVRWSAVGVFTTYLMLLVGLGLVAFHASYPPSGETVALLAAQPDRVFPLFVVEQLPVGLCGLVIAALFAAGISTLDSALTALSQISVQGPLPALTGRAWSETALVRASRLALVGWGLALCGLAQVFHASLDAGLLNLGLAVPGYVFGSLLGIAWLALTGQTRPAHVFAGAIAAVTVVLILRYYDVSFFWWYLAGALVQVGFTRLLDRRSSSNR